MSEMKYENYKYFYMLTISFYWFNFSYKCDKIPNLTT